MFLTLYEVQLKIKKLKRSLLGTKFKKGSYKNKQFLIKC